MSEQRDPHADREWSDQERGLREERLGLASAGAEPRVAQYRLLARVLSEPAEDSLPHNFAALVARRAEAASEMAGDRVERWVQHVLLAVLALMFIAFFAGDLPARRTSLAAAPLRGGSSRLACASGSRSSSSCGPLLPVLATRGSRPGRRGDEMAGLAMF
jgi:hypothetical protein